MPNDDLNSSNSKSGLPVSSNTNESSFGTGPIPSSMMPEKDLTLSQNTFPTSSTGGETGNSPKGGGGESKKVLPTLLSVLFIASAVFAGVFLVQQQQELREEASGDHKVVICHIPPGNTENPQLIDVDRNSWVQGHSPHNAHNMDFVVCKADDGDDRSNDDKERDEKHKRGRKDRDDDNDGKKNHHDEDDDNDGKKDRDDEDDDNNGKKDDDEDDDNDGKNNKDDDDCDNNGKKDDDEDKEDREKNRRPGDEELYKNCKPASECRPRPTTTTQPSPTATATPSPTGATNNPASCPAGTTPLFASAGALNVGTSVSLGGTVSSENGSWNVSTQNGVLLASGGSKITVNFPNNVLLGSALIYDNDPKSGENPWSINGTSLPTTPGNAWGPLFNLNKTANQMVFDNGGDSPHFNVCVKAGTPTNSPTPTATIPPDVVAKCNAVKVYDLQGNMLSQSDLSQLNAGDKVRFAVSGQANLGTFSKARFTINNVLQPETTLNTAGEFYMDYTIPQDTTSFTVRGEVNHSSLGWI